MHPLDTQLAMFDESAAAIPLQLQIAIRLSFDAVTEEPLPHEMALLLLRLAMAELFRNAEHDADAPAHGVLLEADRL